MLIPLAIGATSIAIGISIPTSHQEAWRGIEDQCDRASLTRLVLPRLLISVIDIVGIPRIASVLCTLSLCMGIAQYLLGSSGHILDCATRCYCSEQLASLKQHFRLFFGHADVAFRSQWNLLNTSSLDCFPKPGPM
jgi:hypothetical protein